MGNVTGISDNPFAAIGLGPPPQEEVPDNELGQDEFLRLLSAQLQSQDPLNPQSNGEFIAQLASFSTADGIQDLIGAFEGFSSQITSGQALQASTLVGREVLLPTSIGRLDRVTGGLTGQVGVPPGTQNVTLDISNSRGEFVRRVELGDQVAGGQVNFVWDGFTPDGERADFNERYFVQASGIVGTGEREALTTSLNLRVNSVTLNQGNGQGVQLNLDGGLGQANLSDVIQVGLQG